MKYRSEAAYLKSQPLFDGTQRHLLVHRHSVACNVHTQQVEVLVRCSRNDIACPPICTLIVQGLELPIDALSQQTCPASGTKDTVHAHVMALTSASLLASGSV